MGARAPEGAGGLDAGLYAGLQELAAGAFPKRCANCGEVFADVDDYLRRTGRVASGASGLKQSHDEDGRVIVELFRNCICGSTLMDNFNDRRDTSAAGERRRARFSELMERLAVQGLSPELARAELLKVLNGEPSAVLRAVPRDTGR